MTGGITIEDKKRKVLSCMWAGYLVIRWAAVTHPVSRSELKYSRVYPIRGPIWWTPVADLVDPPDPAMPGL